MNEPCHAITSPQKAQLTVACMCSSNVVSRPRERARLVQASLFGTVSCPVRPGASLAGCSNAAANPCHSSKMSNVPLSTSRHSRDSPPLLTRRHGRLIRFPWWQPHRSMTFCLLAELACLPHIHLSYQDPQEVRVFPWLALSS